MDDLPRRITTLRQRARLTKTALAERAGVDPSAVMHWEAGRSRPRRLDKVCKALGVTMASFWSVRLSRKR